MIQSRRKTNNKGVYGFYYRHIKRLLDIAFAIAAITVFCWLYAIIAFLVLIKLGRPVIYKGKRIGKGEREFTLYKFRSMTNECDANGDLLCDSKRLSKFGAFLRSTSLDELPEAWNILKGDMSLIGPRPLLLSYLPYYTRQERKRHLIRGGLSGLAQVNGRNAIIWEERFTYDIQYVESVSFMLDLSIVLKTLLIVMKRSDIGLRGVSDNAVDFNIHRSKPMEEDK
jgi:undecaprenyl phosphate N,N'-diacetylbacillosamine 1-phosphate transferase